MQDAFVVTDRQTGETFDTGDVSGLTDLVVPGREEPLAALIRGSQGGTMPIHIKKMLELQVPSRVAATYWGVRPEPVSAWLARPVEIRGAIVYFSGSYRSRESNELVDGYYKILVKTTIEKEMPLVGTTATVKFNVVLATSGIHVAQAAMAMMEEHGWYDFRDNHTEWVVFTCEKPGEPQYMYPIPEPKKGK